MKSTIPNCARGLAFAQIATLALVVVTLATSSSCTSRRQYAINEELLIDNRRLLEDELYRVQFELRDALEENERLRAKLEKDNDERPRNERRLNTTTPQRADSLRKSDDERFFPGGDALRTNGQSANEIETLPDFVPIPSSREDAQQRKRSLAQANYVDVAPPRIANAATQNTEELRDESAQESANYQDEAYDTSEEEEDDWTPVS